MKIIDSTPSASIAPVSAAFDKAANLAQDISVALTLNGHQLASITNGNSTLLASQDYTASSAAVVLKKSYLSTLPLGQNTITFHFNGGNNAVLTVNVTDSSVPVPTGDLTVQAFNGNTSASTNGISPKIKVVNTVIQRFN